jgi:arylsulfatase A
MRRRKFLKSVAATAITRRRSRAASSSPNIILILCDDLGYGDVGCYGSKIRTPNIDRMAGEGVRFEHFYAASAVCSPSRAALMTGRYPTRVGVAGVLDPNDAIGLPDSETTLAQMLSAAGYATMCVGKWHLGRRPKFLPTNRGFDEYYGIPYSNDMYPQILMHNTDVIEQPVRLDTLTARYTEQAVRFINANQSNPFFLYFPHTFPHIPLAASEAFRGKSPLGIYGDVVEELDWSVGEVLRAVRGNDLDESTLILFSSDNGPWYQGSPGPLRGRKGETFDGGVRVPFLARMPGRIPAGQVTSSMATLMDILPTVARLTGAGTPANPLDGVNIWPLLTGDSADVDRPLFLYFDGWNLQCARMGPWKLHLARFNVPPYAPVPPEGRMNLPLPRPELYDLMSDPEESYDCSEHNPDVVADIRTRIDALLPTFPDAVRNAWNDTRKRAVEGTPSGALPSARQDP